MNTDDRTTANTDERTTASRRTKLRQTSWRYAKQGWRQVREDRVEAMVCMLAALGLIVVWAFTESLCALGRLLVWAVEGAFR